MLEKKAEKKIAAVYFVSLGAIMYFCLDGYIDLGVYITYRHALALLLVFSAFCAFLVRPDVARMAAAFKDCLAFCAPTFVFLVFSLFIWAHNREDPAIIARDCPRIFSLSTILPLSLQPEPSSICLGRKGSGTIWYPCSSRIYSCWGM